MILDDTLSKDNIFGENMNRKSLIEEKLFIITVNIKTSNRNNQKQLYLKINENCVHTIDLLHEIFR